MENCKGEKTLGNFKFAPPNKNPIKLSGTFISMWLVENWDDATWEKELTAYQEVGIEYVIFSPGVVITKDRKMTTYYPTNIDEYKCGYIGKDVFENILRNCQKFGMKCFIGTLQEDLWWDLWWDYSKTMRNYDWFMECMHQSNRLAEDIYRQYAPKYKDTMCGWYLIWEIWNFTVMKLSQAGRSGCIKMLCDGFNIHLDFLTSLDATMPVLTSPFVNRQLGSVEDLRHMWGDIVNNTNFRPGDILCPQDSVGAGGTKLDQLEEVMQAYVYAKTFKPHMKLWANNEDFDQRDWSSATMDRFIKQMEISAKYAEKNITFAYNNYHSPVNIQKGFHQAFKYYLANGCAKICVPPGVTDLNASKTVDGVMLSWNQPQKETIAGYVIFKNTPEKDNFGNAIKKRIGTVKLGYRGNDLAPPELKTSYLDKIEYLDAKDFMEYTIISHDFFGNYSLESTVRI